MMGDAFDMCTDAETDTQAEDVYNQILGEIGMNLNDDMKTNNNAIAQPQPAAVGEVSTTVSFFLLFIDQFCIFFNRIRIFKLGLTH